MTNFVPAIVALADGTIFRGQSCGAPSTITGEVVFNTSMTGYQEILTDPSYCGQIVTMTCPHIGNVGVNPEDVEANRLWAAGLIVREISRTVSNWRASESLPDYLRRHNLPGLTEIDTRALVRHIRTQGAMMAAGPRGRRSSRISPCGPSKDFASGGLRNRLAAARKASTQIWATCRVVRSTTPVQTASASAMASVREAIASAICSSTLARSSASSPAHSPRA